jgi:peptidoglycan/LPS O-acetylase OafA/YrhL
MELKVTIQESALSPNTSAKAVSNTNAPRVKVQFLDGIRGLAAIFVLCQHTGYLHGMNVGAVGVHTFFVLSACLLTMLLEKKVETLYQERASRARWGYALLDYAVRRVLRVYPLVMAVGIMLAFSSEEHQARWYIFETELYHFNFFKLLVFAEGHQFFVFWTLPLELTYYLCIPVFVMVTMRLRRWWWVPFLPLTVWIVHAGLYVKVLAFQSLWKHLPEFVTGSIGAVVYNRASAWIQHTGFVFRWWHRLLIRTLEIIVLTLLVSVVFSALVFDWFGPYPFQIPNSDHFVCVHVMILILCELLVPGPLASVLEWSLLRHAGKVSFSMYLLHPRIVRSVFIATQHNYYTRFFATWGLVFFWATVSYHCIEYPSLRLAAAVGKKIKALESKE